VLASRGAVVLFTDADMSTPIADAELLLAALRDGADVAIGSRAIEGRRLVEQHQPWHRELMGRIFNLMVQAILLPGLWDTQCGFKAFHGDLARELLGATESEGFEFDVEVLYRARRRGSHIREVAVHWHDVTGSRVSPLRDSARMFAALFRIRRRVR
jgi:dolichyl-phosphate beta-glucosyltransferase